MSLTDKEKIEVIAHMHDWVSDDYTRLTSTAAHPLTPEKSAFLLYKLQELQAPLKEISLTDGSVDEHCMTYLATFQPKSLDIKNNPITFDGINPLLDHSKSLESLDIRGTNIGPESIKVLAKLVSTYMPALKTLYMDANLENAFFAALDKNTKLERVNGSLPPDLRSHAEKVSNKEPRIVGI